MVIPLVASGEIDLSFASTYGLSAYVFALLVTAGIDPAIAFLEEFVQMHSLERLWARL